MPFRRYSLAEKQHAIATAVIVGVEAAVASLGYPEVRALQQWMATAGRAPMDALTAADWQGPPEGCGGHRGDLRAD